MNTLVGFGCLGPLIAAAVVALTIVLPISTFVRLRRALDSIERLRLRVSELEESVEDMKRSRQTPLATAPAAVQPPTRPVQPPPAQDEPREARAVAPAPPPPIVLTPEVLEPEPVTATPGPVPVRVGGSLETEIGGRWLLYIGMAALVFGVGFFVKYAFDNEWINETARVVMGGLFGLVMVVAGRRFASKGYGLYGQVVAGGGFVAMYVSTWAALNLYGLISRPTAFVILACISAGAAFMADALRSQALAFVAVLGGFATPVLVGGREDAQVTLLTYVAIVAAGTIGLAERRSWPALTLTSYVLTVLTFQGWADIHYAAAKYVTTQFYLVLFAVMFGAVYWRERVRVPFARSPFPTLLFLSVPLLFHAASVANLFDHSLPLLLYLLLFTLAGVAASAKWDLVWVRIAVFVATMPVFMGWVSGHTTPGWRAATIVVAVALYVMHLAAQGERLTRETPSIDTPEVALFHANALMLFAGLYAVVNVAWPYSTAALALALAAWQGLLSWRARSLSGDAAVNGLAAAFAMIGFAVGLQFDDWWALVGWAVEAGAIYWAGLRTGRAWIRWGGALVLAVVIGRLFEMDYFGTPAGFEALVNPRAGTTVIVIGVLYAMSFFFRQAVGADTARPSPEYAALLVGANALTIVWLSAEINSYWGLRTGDDATASLSLLVSLSIAWGLYGTILLGVGIQRRYAPLRYLSIAVLLLTVAKVFLVDLSELGGVYRIIGFMGLGVFLLLGAWLYQRFRDVILGTKN